MQPSFTIKPACCDHQSHMYVYHQLYLCFHISTEICHDLICQGGPATCSPTNSVGSGWMPAHALDSFRAGHERCRRDSTTAGCPWRLAGTHLTPLGYASIVTTIIIFVIIISVIINNHYYYCYYYYYHGACKGHSHRLDQQSFLLSPTVKLDAMSCSSVRMHG